MNYQPSAQRPASPSMKLKTVSMILVIYLSFFSGLCFAKSPWANIPGLTDKITPDIDKWYKPPAIVFRGDDPFRIISIASVSKKNLKINAKDISGKEVIITLNLNDDGSFWFEPIEGLTSGKDFIYKRISRPE